MLEDQVVKKSSIFIFLFIKISNSIIISTMLSFLIGYMKGFGHEW